MTILVLSILIAILTSLVIVLLAILIFLYRRIKKYATSAMQAMIETGERQGIKIDTQALSEEYHKNVAQQEKDEKRLRYLEGVFNRLVYLKETLYDRGGVMTIFDFKKLLISVISEE